MRFETRNLIFRVTMAAVVSVVAIFVIHVAAALYHHFGKRDRVLAGMIGRAD